MHKRARVRWRGSVRLTRLEKGSFPLNLSSTWHYVIIYSVEMQGRNVTRGRRFTSSTFLGLESHTFVEPVILFLTRMRPLTTNTHTHARTHKTYFCTVTLPYYFLYLSSRVRPYLRKHHLFIKSRK